MLFLFNMRVLLLLMCSFFWQTARVSPSSPPTYEVEELANGRMPEDQHYRLSHSGGHRVPQGMNLGRAQKRDDQEEDDFRVQSIDIVTSTLPIIDAAHNFEMFYGAILYNALAPWANSPPQMALVMTLGCLQLSMSIEIYFGPPRGIPWAFVRNFATNMLTMTRMGFAGTYDMYYVSNHGVATPEYGLRVTLRISWPSIGRHLAPSENRRSLPPRPP